MNRNGKGPENCGPMTGRGHGPCCGNDSLDESMIDTRGMGRGLGRGRGAGGPGWSRGRGRGRRARFSRGLGDGRGPGGGGRGPRRSGEHQ